MKKPAIFILISIAFNTPLLSQTRGEDRSILKGRPSAKVTVPFLRVLAGNIKSEKVEGLHQFSGPEYGGSNGFLIHDGEILYCQIHIKAHFNTAFTLSGHPFDRG